jgi:hypothetical protein
MNAFQILLQTLKQITTLEADEEVLFQKAFQSFCL